MPALMDGTITLKALERQLHYFYEMQATQSPDQLAFPSMPDHKTSFTPTSSAQSSLSSPTIALPASFPP